MTESSEQHLVRSLISRERYRLIQLAALPLLFYGGVKLSLLFAVLPEVVVILWLPNGLLLAALLHYGLRHYAYFAGLIIAAELAADYPTFSPVEAGLFAGINLLEVTVAYLLLRRWRFNPRFAVPSDIAKFLIAGPVLSALVAACLAAAVYRHFRASETTYVELLRVWWFSDGTGLLIVTALVLSIWPPKAGRAHQRVALRWFDGIVAGIALVVVGLLLLATKGAFRGMPIPPATLLPFVVYAAARLTPRSATMVTAGLAVIVLFVTKNGQQPFGDLAVADTVLQAQQLVFIMTVTALGLAALLSQLRGTALELEARVQDRTAQLRAANDQLQTMALTDSLSGLLNRRALFDVMRREVERNRRHRHGLAVLMFDIDHFKNVNDRYGHAVGDRVLRHVAAVAAGTVRSTDALARYGGEEFVIVAPETDLRQALQLAERIRVAVQSSEIGADQHTLQVTASFGAAIMRDDDEEPDQILRRVDTALYTAKAAGRNRVVADTQLPATTS
jgi:diguanylate cyclase (GGDEF)-like protein